MTTSKQDTQIDETTPTISAGDVLGNEIANDVAAELESLKQIAKNKGITFSGNISVDKLKARIDAFDKEFETKKAKQAPEVGTVDFRDRHSIARARNILRQQQRKEQLKLVRVIVTSNSPAHSKNQGIWLSAGNSVLGNTTKYVLFEREYHLPAILVQVLKEKTYRTSIETVNPRTGRKIRDNKFRPQFNVQVLPPLTEKELKELADDQRARGDGIASRR